MTTVAVLEAASAHPSAPALFVDGATWTWRELQERVRARREELAPGPSVPRRVGFFAPTSPDLVVTLFAWLEAGATLALAHPRWPRGLAEECLAFVDALPQSATRVARQQGTRSLDDEATVLFTSGTRGRPKAVVHTLDQHRQSALGSGAVIPFGPGDRWLLSLPLCHVGGLSLLFRAATSGGALALPRPGERLEAALIRLRPTHVSLVAAQLVRALNDDGATAALAAAKTVLLGGGPLPRGLLEQAQAAGVAVRQTYGSTEMASQVCTSTTADAGTCGRPLPGREVRLSDAGEVLVRGSTLMKGYLEDAATWRLHLPVDDEGWFPTGDLGQLDDEGRLIVLGRRDNLFISGGENVAPEAVEEALAAVPGVELAVVVPVGDERFGARPCAFVRFLDDAPFDEQALAARVAERLPDFMRPVAFLPLGADLGLKPRRPELVRRACAALNRPAPP